MNLSPLLRQRFFDVNGLPLAGGQLFSYQAGTTTPQATYSNATGTVNTNPVVLDASGYADVWIDPTLAYKFILEDSLNNVQWTVDQVSSPLSTAAWSANITYSQGAIVQDSSGQGLLYVSLINNNLNNALTSVGSWRVFAGNVRTLASNTTLAVTDDLIRSNSTSGSLTHTLPACSTTPIGKKITVKDVGTGGNSTQVKGSGSDNVDGANTYATALPQYASVTFENNGSSWDSNTPALSANSVTTAAIATGAVTQAKLAARASGSTVAAGGVATSASSGAFSTTSLTPVAVTNLSVTITTTGRPVFVGLISDTTAHLSYLAAIGIGGLTTAGANAFIERGATVIAEYPIITEDSSTPAALGVTIPVSAVWTIDPVAVGTYTYSINLESAGLGQTAYIEYAQLIAYEL